MNTSKTSLNDLIDYRIGYIFSENGVYEPDTITFTVESGKRVEIGDIVCIKHPSIETLVFYQVIEVPVRRKARDYEEDLVRIGQPLLDDTRNYPRARAKQIGYIDDLDKLMSGETSIDDLMMLIEHIKPLSEVYKPKPEVIDKLLSPPGDSIVIGKIYPSWKHEYRFDLKRLLRQGLLVVGGVGTGKTTTMLTIIYRLVKTFLEKKGKPHILIIDKDGEYGPGKLVDLVGNDNYVRIHIDDITEKSFRDREAFANMLLGKLGYYSRRTKEAQILYNIIKDMNEEVYELKPSFIDKLISKIKEQLKLQYGRSRETYMVIWNKLNRLKEELSRSGEDVEEHVKLDIIQVIQLLREKIIVHIDLSRTRDFDHAYIVLANILKAVYREALDDQSFGCIIVIDEAHLYAPEKGGISLTTDDKIMGSLKSILHLIATTGPRNGVTPFIATQRPSLISKTITTQMGQNIIAHRVEDVDLARIEEIMGPIARRVRILPRGWAIVKGLAAKIREPLIIKIEAELYPESTGKTAYERFLNL